MAMLELSDQAPDWTARRGDVAAALYEAPPGGSSVLYLFRMLRPEQPWPPPATVRRYAARRVIALAESVEWTWCAVGELEGINLRDFTAWRLVAHHCEELHTRGFDVLIGTHEAG